MAATYQVVPPEAFNFNRPEEWTKWIRRFERFRKASGLETKDEEAQVNTLIYTMGDKGDDILRSFNLSEADKKKYDTVKEKFDSHFVKRRNVIYERAKFNMRKQEEGETIDSFVTALYALAEHCGYADLHDEMIRDRLVVGLRDAKLSEKLQLDSELTLDKAITQARQTEAVHQQQPLLRGEGAEKNVPVGAVHKRTSTPQRKSGYRPRPQSGMFTSSNRTSCSRCGKSPVHDRQHCPAKDAICRKCHKRGHFRAVCRTTRVGGVSEEDSQFLGAVTNQNVSNPWETMLLLNDTSVKFQIDTGAEVTVISLDTYKAIGSPPLVPSSKTLRGPSGKILPVMGKFESNLRSDSHVVQWR